MADLVNIGVPGLYIYTCLIPGINHSRHPGPGMGNRKIILVIGYAGLIMLVFINAKNREIVLQVGKQKPACQVLYPPFFIFDIRFQSGMACKE